VVYKSCAANSLKIPISLEVPPFSARLLREKDFIEATSRLSSFNIMSRPGIPISPIEIRLTKDRLTLVSRVLSSNADAYKHTQVILDLIYKLGFRDDEVAEVKTLAMLAESALQAEDFARAYEINDRMYDKVLKLRSVTDANSKIPGAVEFCWVASFQLGRQTEFDDTTKKLTLLGRALELCPPEKLHDILTAWRKVEKDDIEIRKEKLANRRDGVPRQKTPSKATPSLASRIQNMRIASAALAQAPDIASRTFNRVAANFNFSMGNRGRDLTSGDGERSNNIPDSGDVSAQATRALQKGIGWLIGNDD
jgi:neuroblastoma-amplified sequence